MRKIFQLHVEGRHPDRVLDAIKHDIRKYFQRERRRALPEGANFWDFDCRFGLTQEDAVAVPEAKIRSHLDAAARDSAKSVYVEVLARPAARAPRTDAPTADDPAGEPT